MDRECWNCDCYDEDMGCTMPSIDKSYACPKNQTPDEQRSSKSL